MKMKTLAQVNSKANYSFDPVDVASCPPEVLARVARCISIWSLIEALTANVALFAVKGDMRVPMEMYLSITSSGAANAALKTAVRVGLEPKYRELFDAIWTISGELASERHKLAHWGMGYFKGCTKCRPASRSARWPQAWRTQFFRWTLRTACQIYTTTDQ
jgi:hypothetical protein